MKKVLYILGGLDDADAEWLVQEGRSMEIPDGQSVIREGEAIDAVFFVTDGVFRVTTRTSDADIALIGTGEVLGEVSFIDRRPPTATVTAVSDGRVLAIPRAALTEKLAADPGFASRFYQAIATFLADRLRSTLQQVGGGTPEEDDSLDLDELHTLSQGGIRFERILRRLQKV